MGQVLIQEHTTKNPITLIGEEAGLCWGSPTDNPDKNYKRGIEILKSEHGRPCEFPDVYMVLDGYSARVIREWYTHIGGAPTRLQASTRYIDYQKGFDYYTPPSISINAEALEVYEDMMNKINQAMQAMEFLGIPREDSALGLPLGMTTKIVCKHNLRNLIDMSHQRMCGRAYHEYRQLFADLRKALSEYSEEWRVLVDGYFKPKCHLVGYCKEKHGCGAMPSLSETEVNA